MTAARLTRCLIAATLAAGLSATALAGERATPREAHALFDQAVKYMESKGPERAFAAFNDRKGPFVKKDLYVFVIDRDGTYHASGAAPEALVGLNVLNTTDAAGTPLFRQMIDTTKAAPEGQVHYVWLNRKTNKVEPKVSYVHRVGDYVLGVGYSAPRSNPEAAWSLLERAVDEVQAEGMDKAAAVFNDGQAPFVKDDLYVFAVDVDSGRFRAMGMNPKLTGTEARDLKDAAGDSIIQEMIDKTANGGEAIVEYVWRNPVTNAVEHKRSYVRREGHILLGVGYYGG